MLPSQAFCTFWNIIWLEGISINHRFLFNWGSSLNNQIGNHSNILHFSTIPPNVRVVFPSEFYKERGLHPPPLHIELYVFTGPRKLLLVLLLALRRMEKWQIILYGSSTSDIKKKSIGAQCALGWKRQSLLVIIGLTICIIFQIYVI